MAKRKTLKRNIGYVAGELFTEILVAKMLVPNIDHDKADALMGRILDMQDNFVERAAKPDGKDNKKLVKEYYKKLYTDLQTEIDAIAEELEKLSKDKIA